LILDILDQQKLIFFLEIQQKLGWNREYNLKDLVNDMMKSDLKLMTKDGGYKIMSK